MRTLLLINTDSRTGYFCFCKSLEGYGLLGPAASILCEKLDEVLFLDREQELSYILLKIQDADSGQLLSQQASKQLSTVEAA